MNSLLENYKMQAKYLKYQKEAQGKSEKTIKKIKYSLFIFDEFFKKDYKYFNSKVAISYKEYLENLLNKQTKEPISLSTKRGYLNDLKIFLYYLIRENGYKKSLNYHDIEYLNLSISQNTSLININDFKEYPNIEQCKKALLNMKEETLIEKRNKALFACLVISGARIESLISLKLGSVDINKKLIKQRAKEGIKTKFSKNIDTFYFPVGNEFIEVFNKWHLFLQIELGYKNNYPLFPKAYITLDEDLFFKQEGFSSKPKFFTSTTQARNIIEEAFKKVGYIFNPHSIRHMLAHIGEERCSNPEEMKAWSQNLGHSNVSTTFQSYGNVHINRVGIILENLKVNN